MAVTFSKETQQKPSSQEVVIRTKGPHKARRFGLAALLALGIGVGARQFDVGQKVENAIGGEINKGIRNALGAFGIHFSGFGGKSKPAEAVTSVDHKAETIDKFTFVGGGRLSTYVALNACQYTRWGGESFKKLMPADTLVGNQPQRLNVVAKEVWDDKTTYKGSKMVRQEKILEEVDVMMPTPEELSPRIVFSGDAVMTNLRPGDSPAVITQKIARYQKAVEAGHAPSPDSGVSYRRSIWLGNITGVINEQEAFVPTLGYIAGQEAIDLDAFDPYDPKVQSLVSNTDNAILSYEQGLHPGVPIVAEYPPLPDPTKGYLDIIAQRYQDTNSNPANKMTGVQQYFSIQNEKQGHTTVHDLAFSMNLPNGQHALVTFDLPVTQSEVTSLNTHLGLHELNVSSGQ